MKTVNLSMLKANDSEYEELVKKVEQKYECEWDDAVHESYQLYVQQVQEYGSKIHIIRCKAESLAEEIAGLNVDGMIQRAEALCDSFTGLMESKYSETGFKLKPRFSPGYGDLPLEMQVEILKILDAQKIMGLYLNDSYLITPSKTVTAIIGLY